MYIIAEWGWGALSKTAGENSYISKQHRMRLKGGRSRQEKEQALGWRWGGRDRDTSSR